MIGMFFFFINGIWNENFRAIIAYGITVESCYLEMIIGLFFGIGILGLPSGSQTWLAG